MASDGRMQSSLSIYESVNAEDTYSAILNNATGGLQMSVLSRMRAVLKDVFAERSRNPNGVKIILTYSSNLISTGLRDLFASLVEGEKLDAVITTAGGVEEDVIKCLGHTYIGEFSLPGKSLRLKGMNRVGNLIIPNANYVNFETLMIPLITEFHKRQAEAFWGAKAPSALERHSLVAPSAFISAMGRALTSASAEELIGTSVDCDHPSSAGEFDLGRAAERREAIARRLMSSLVFWCTMKGVPLYCPALTDGSIGDMVCFYGFKNKGLIIDPAADVGCLVDLFERNRRVPPVVNSAHDEKVTESDLQEIDTLEDVHVVVIALGAGLPRNHALVNTPSTGSLIKRGERVMKVRRTILSIVTGIEPDACRSSVTHDDEVLEGIINTQDESYRLHGDATILFPLLLAANV